MLVPLPKAGPAAAEPRARRTWETGCDFQILGRGAVWSLRLRIETQNLWLLGFSGGVVLLQGLPRASVPARAVGALSGRNTHWLPIAVGKLLTFFETLEWQRIGERKV